MPTLKILGQSKVDTVRNLVKSTLGVEIEIFDQSNKVAPGDVTLGSIRSRSPKQTEIKIVGQTLVQNVERYFEKNYGVKIEILTGAGVKAATDMTLGSVRSTYSLDGESESRLEDVSQVTFAHHAEMKNKEKSESNLAELEMQINSFKLEEADTSGDCPITLELTIANNTTCEISRIKYDVFYFQGAAHLVAKSLGNSEECFLEGDDSEEISDTWFFVERRLLKSDEDITARVQARVFRKEIIKFGPFELPSISGVKYYEAPIDSQTLGNRVGVTLYRHEPDEDGDVRIDANCVVDNHTSSPLEDVELNIQIVDSGGDDIESAAAINNLPSFSMAEIDPTIFVKKSYLKSANVSFSIVLYHLVGRGRVTASAPLPRIT
jgi:hypothetical protein